MGHFVFIVIAKNHREGICVGIQKQSANYETPPKTACNERPAITAVGLPHSYAGTFPSVRNDDK